MNIIVFVIHFNLKCTQNFKIKRGVTQRYDIPVNIK